MFSFLAMVIIWFVTSSLDPSGIPLFLFFSLFHFSIVVAQFLAEISFTIHTVVLLVNFYLSHSSNQIAKQSEGQLMR
jgi:hypothetical protein